MSRNKITIKTALKYLFYGRKEIMPGQTPIEIGSHHDALKRLSIAIDWNIMQVDQDGQHIRPLRPEDSYTFDILKKNVLLVEGDDENDYSIRN